jgi:adenosine deaminase
MLHMRENKDLVDLISNRLLGYVPNLADHPFRVLAFGIPVCLNTDDRGCPR